MAEQPPAGFRRHRFLDASIDLPEYLNEAQLDGRAYIRCGHEAESGEAMRPVEAWTGWPEPQPRPEPDEARVALTDLGRRALAMERLFGPWPTLAQANAAEVPAA